MSLLQHPNVVKLHGISVDPFCLVCEFIPHGDLYKCVLLLLLSFLRNHSNIVAGLLKTKRSIPLSPIKWR